MKKQVNARYQDLYIGLVRVHVLHHASQELIFGLGMIQELGRHGYRLGPGTMYPLLHSMERRGWLKVQTVVIAGKRRRCYKATRAGHSALKEAIGRVRELLKEIDEDES